MNIRPLLLLLLFCACKATPNEQGRSIDQSQSAAIDSLGNRYLELQRFSGSLLIGLEGEIVYFKNFGLADYELQKPFGPQTAFKIGGISEWVNIKMLTELIADKNLSVETSVSPLISTAPKNLKIKDLLEPNSAFPNHLRGRTLEALEQRPYSDILRTYSEGKALQNTFFDQQNGPLAKAYLYHNYRGQGLELQAAPHYELDSVFSTAGLKSTASDLFQLIDFKTEDLALSGYTVKDGFSYSLSHNPSNGLSIIILSNRRHPVGEEMKDVIRSILEGNEYQLPLPREPFAIDPSLLANYEGSYSLNGQMNFRVAAVHDSLFVYLGAQKVHLIPQSSNQFYMRERDAAMRFLSDSTGAVNRIMLLDGFLESEQIAYRDSKE